MFIRVDNDSPLSNLENNLLQNQRQYKAQQKCASRDDRGSMMPERVHGSRAAFKAATASHRVRVKSPDKRCPRTGAQRARIGTSFHNPTLVLSQQWSALHYLSNSSYDCLGFLDFVRKCESIAAHKSKQLHKRTQNKQSQSVIATPPVLPPCRYRFPPLLPPRGLRLHHHHLDRSPRRIDISRLIVTGIPWVGKTFSAHQFLSHNLYGSASLNPDGP